LGLHKWIKFNFNVTYTIATWWFIIIPILKKEYLNIQLVIIKEYLSTLTICLSPDHLPCIMKPYKAESFYSSCRLLYNSESLPYEINTHKWTYSSKLWLSVGTWYIAACVSKYVRSYLINVSVHVRPYPDNFRTKWWMN